MSPPAERRTLGRYELLERLGRGSVTEGFRAKSFGVEGFEKTVVVRRVLPDLALSERFVETLLAHLGRAMRLSHAGLAQIFDVGKVEEPGVGPAYFLATEHVAGLPVETLLERARREGAALPIPLAVYLALEVGKALDHAHRRRGENLEPLVVVHGAVAPHSVLVSFDGDVKLTDFGTARAILDLSAQGESARRTVAAASPEWARGEPLGPASDVFGLGSLLYSTLTGTPPFLGSTVEETLARLVATRPEPLESRRPDVPEPLARLVQRAMAARPENRFPSISAMHEELLACTYACGLRATAAELSGWVDHHRKAPVTIPSEAIDALLSRPLTVPPVAQVDAVSGDRPRGRMTSIPPLTGFGERRHVSILVLAVAPTEPLPPPLLERARATVERYGGTVLREEGSLVTAVFGAETADGRDVERAVRAGLVLVRGLDVGALGPAVGIDSGRVKVDGSARPIDDESTAELVESARRLSHSGVRSVVASRRAAGTLQGRFPLEPYGSGFAVTEFVQDRYLDTFVGRRGELQHLGETLVRAARGEIQIVGIVGEPGIGKTRLAVEMQRRLGRGSIDLATYFGTCPPRGRALPGSGLVMMLRRVLGVRDGDPPERISALAPGLRTLGLSSEEIDTVLEELVAAPRRSAAPAALRSGFLRAVHSLAEERFSVFVWDDAHELDAASADLLVRATRRLASSRVAFVVAGRPLPSAPFLSLPLQSELRLGELDAEEVERLAAARAGAESLPRALTRFVQDRAGGQPLFVEEMVRDLIEAGRLVVENGRVTSFSTEDGSTVPRSLGAVTADRLRRLGDDERNLFVAAAVLEPPVPLDVLSHLVGLTPVATDGVVRSLLGQGLLGQEGPDALGFPSPLAREVVLSELDPEDLLALHERASAAYAAFQGPEERMETGRVAYHLAAAGLGDAAAEHYAESGLHALGRGKLERAATDLAYALDLVNLAARSSAQVGNWLSALSTAVRYARTGPNLPQLVERLVQRIDQSGADPRVRARVRVDAARILGALGLDLAAEGLLDQASAAARAAPDLSVPLLSTYAELASLRGEFRLARRALDPLSRVVVTDPAELHRVTRARARTLSAAGKSGAARAALDDAARNAPKGDPLLELDRRAAQVALLHGAGRFREAVDAASTAALLAEDLGLSHEAASSRADQAVALTRLGDGPRALAVVTAALAAADEIGAERVGIRCRIVIGYLEAAASGASLEEQRGHIAVAESRGWIGDALLGRYLLGRLAALAGTVADARHELLLASRIAASTGNQAIADHCAAELDTLG